jgi:phosphoribosyl 1,2-cyclic phosphodiesterase
VHKLLVNPHRAAAKRTIQTMNSTEPILQSNAPIRIRSLASGSSGNAYLVESGDDLVLIDCGIGIRQIQAALHAWGKTLRDLSAIVISHEHSDHVRSLASFLRQRTPIYATGGTSDALGLSSSCLSTIRYTESFDIGCMAITPIATSHDAAEPCGLLIEASERTIGLITDLGTVTDEIGTFASRCELLILESNHDREMLRSGPYPAHLKKRVAGNFGHLSNDQAGGFLAEIATATSGPSEIWLAHLSATNNTPTVARAAIQDRFRKAGVSPAITVLPRGAPGPIWDGANVRAKQLALISDF